ncbi:MAG TPA: UDP-N-acetylglucosamine 1-carboxyvinyltransferase, partial [Candidatus Paceibacterota bacterium]|nr:UDP-N-acetylglucosamine 1-carboxyvinyltransferase [Candidatus Paceibacterota bacterium]
MTSSEGLHFVVEGGKPLSGSVETARSKNGAVGLLAASLLNRGTTTLLRMPKIEEVNRLIEVLRSIGVEVKWDGNNLVITPPEKIDLASMNREAATRTRSILMFIGPLLHHFKDFEIPQSGGC